MTKEEIGAVLKGLRADSGKTQKEVAEILGRTQQIIGHWETGYSQPDANTLFRLCEIYGTTVDEAFGFKKEKLLVTKKDIDLLRKYHELDHHGKEIIELLLEKEYERCIDSTQQLIKEETQEPPIDFVEQKMFDEIARKFEERKKAKKKRNDVG